MTYGTKISKQMTSLKKNFADKKTKYLKKIISKNKFLCIKFSLRGVRGGTPQRFNPLTNSTKMISFKESLIACQTWRESFSDLDIFGNHLY